MVDARPIYIKVSSSCLFISDVCGVNFVMSGGIAETTYAAPYKTRYTHTKCGDRYKYIVGFIYLLFMYMSPVII